jgi:hypothetical protein
MAISAAPVRIRKSKGPSTAPVVWHLECHEGRNFTIGIYPGVMERWNLAASKWQQAATGFFAEIKERMAPQPGESSETLRTLDRGNETLYATRDEAHTLALRRVRTIALGKGE